MNLNDLTSKENELYKNVIELYDQIQTSETEAQLQTIYNDYRQVHQQYAELAARDNEALKRGLFLQWYALVEPNYLTGIAGIDDKAEKKIIKTLNNKIENNELDDELDWMLNYYLSWDWVFDRFIGYNGLDKALTRRKDNLPDIIGNNDMTRRGQMGVYWNSLTKFKMKQ